MSRSQDDAIQVPEILHDVSAQRSYKKGRFYGKGGFANCYEIIDVKSQKSYAGKIISKKLMVKQNQKEKISQEISIHSSLQHINVVGFNSFFEDSHNVYIVLELCKRRSMMELQKRRKTLTEPETRFFIKQILTGVQYLHSQKIIHRDLKLGNLFLNDEFHVKIGDFGLATKIEYSGERKQTLCGTPNYIAPEILNKQGHSFEVDVWSIGCIMYTLLVGKPPFETKSLKETYSRIKKCDYKITSELSVPAKLMITSMLQSDPSKRPTVSRLSTHRFMSSGHCPTKLPISALTIAPRFDNIDMKSPMRGVLKEQIPGNQDNYQNMRNSIAAGLVGTMTNFDGQEHLMDLKHQIVKMIKSKPTLYKVIRDEMTDPASQPTIWISKWVDYSDKYGFGYQLSDESVGVMFNDATRLIMFHNEINVQYVDKNGKETHMTVDSFPSELEKKMKLLSYFSRYMKEHLVMTGASVAKEIDHMSRLPCLHQWCRSTSGVLMQLNNGTVQVNFGDHTKLILCPLMAAVTYVDIDKSFNTFKMSTLEKRGCPEALFEKIRYTYDKICSLIEKNC